MKRAILFACALSLAACSAKGEGLNPAPGGPVSDAGPDDGGPRLDAGPVKRTVEQRNPFGNVAETENLLWDGDFEWFSAFSDQYGWYAGNSPNNLDFTFTDIRVGGVCRSGLKCAGLAKGHIIAGIAVASQGHKLEASFWAHLTKGSCDGVHAFVAALVTMADPDVKVTSMQMAPDFNGWCFYDTIVDARSTKPYLLIENETGDDVVIDDAVLKKVEDKQHVTAWHGPLTAEETTMLDQARASLIRLRGPHDAPPNEARRAYERMQR